MAIGHIVVNTVLMSVHQHVVMQQLSIKVFTLSIYALVTIYYCVLCFFPEATVPRMSAQSLMTTTMPRLAMLVA